MGSKFEEFMREIEQEAEAEGPDALEEIRLFEKHYSKVRNNLTKSTSDKTTQKIK